MIASTVVERAPGETLPQEGKRILRWTSQQIHANPSQRHEMSLMLVKSVL
jgi:hypothetical protein